MIDFEKFEKQCDEIREINAKYIEEFVDELSKKGFVDKTIKRHYENVDFYLNTYLLRENALTMENGCKDEYLSDFFGYFFIRKCMWSTPIQLSQQLLVLKSFIDLCMNRIDYQKKTMKNSWIQFVLIRNIG